MPWYDSTSMIGSVMVDFVSGKWALFHHYRQVIFNTNTYMWYYYSRGKHTILLYITKLWMEDGWA